MGSSFVKKTRGGRGKGHNVSDCKTSLSQTLKFHIILLSYNLLEIFNTTYTITRQKTEKFLKVFRFLY